MILFVLVICCCYLVGGEITEPCATPDSKQGQSTKLSSCPRLLTMLRTSNLTDDVQFFQRSQRGFQGRNAKVCCGTGNGTTVPYLPPLRDEVPRFVSAFRFGGVEDILPRNDCGLYSEQKIINGVITAIDEFPWMVLLKYNTSNGIKAACGGVIITKRFVLTAAHCIVGNVAKTLGQPIIVTVGEYNLDDVKDCDIGSGALVCNVAIDVPIERLIVHESYMRPPDRRNDIALIRVAQEIEFDYFFVAPICLPGPTKILLKPGTNVSICGWGQYKKYDSSFSKIKQQARVPVFDTERCHYIYHRNKIDLEKEKVICAGGEKEDTCPGDSGGPLMAPHEIEEGDLRYFALGIVSFGPRDCGTQGIPSIYTKVEFFMDWIVNKLTQYHEEYKK